AFGIVAVRGVSGDPVSALVTAAQQADATVTGTLWLEDKWALKDADSVKALQDALGTTTKNKSSLRIEGYQQLAQRLAAPDLVAGPVTVVLAMSDLFLTPPVPGKYGYGPDTQPIPDPVTQ